MPRDIDTRSAVSPEIRIAGADAGALRLSARAAGRLERDRLVASDGADLPMRIWLPASPPRAVILALHGFNDYSNAFAGTGERFARHGIATYAYDQRGFGGAPLRGRWAGTRAMVDDAVTAIGLLRARYPGVPLYLIGESMGGAVALLAVNRIAATANAPDGVVLLAPAVWGRATMNVFERIGLWVADLMPNVHWSPSLIPIKIRASDNIAALRALGADPLVIKTARSDTLNGLVDLMGEALAAAPYYTAKSLILYGEHDQIVPRAPMARFVAALPAAGAPRQRVALYPRGYHLLLRDLDGQDVATDVLSWINDPSAPLPSGADRDARQRLTGRPSPSPTANARSVAAAVGSVAAGP